MATASAGDRPYGSFTAATPQASAWKEGCGHNKEAVAPIFNNKQLG